MKGQWGRLLRGTAVVFVGNTGGAVLGLLAFVLLARALSPAQFGLLSPMISILDVTQIFMDTVIGGSTLIYAGRFLKTEPARADMAFKIGFWFRIAVVAVTGAAGWLGAPHLSELLYGDAHWAPELRWCFAGGVGVALYTASITVLQARQRFYRLGLVVLYKNLLRAGGVLALLVLGFVDVTAAVRVFVAAALVAGLLGLLSVPHDYLRRPGLDRDAARALLANNGWMILLLILFVMGSRMDVFMLTSLSNPEQVGHYAAAFQLSSVLALLSQAMMTTLLPEVSSYRTADEMRRYLRNYVRLIPLLMLGVAVFVYVGPDLVSLVLGRAYADAGAVFKLLIISSFLTMASNPVLMLLFPLGRIDVLAGGAALQIAMRVLLNLAVIPAHGAMGAAAVDVGAKVVSVALMLGITLWALRRHRGAAVPLPAVDGPEG